MQVVGPTVRAFGLCVDATLKGICEPLSPALYMLLIPHIPDTVAKLAGLFRAMPDLASCLLTHNARVQPRGKEMKQRAKCMHQPITKAPSILMK